MSNNSLLVKIAEERQMESEAVEEFMLNEDDRDERLKAHYRQGKIVDGKWVNDEEEEEYICDEKENCKDSLDCRGCYSNPEEEWTEFHVEYGYTIPHETYPHPPQCSKSYDNEEEAKAEYDRMVFNHNGKYDYVWLVMRHMEGEDCVCSETIEEWKTKRPLTEWEQDVVRHAEDHERIIALEK